MTLLLLPAAKGGDKLVFSKFCLSNGSPGHVREKNKNKFKNTIEIVQRMYYTKNRKKLVTFPVTLLER